MKKRISILEGLLQAFVALGALPCGVLLMVFPDGHALKMDLSMLKGSPFATFFCPASSCSRSSASAIRRRRC